MNTNKEVKINKKDLIKVTETLHSLKKSPDGWRFDVCYVPETGALYTGDLHINDQSWSQFNENYYIEFPISKIFADSTAEQLREFIKDVMTVVDPYNPSDDDVLLINGLMLEHLEYPGKNGKKITPRDLNSEDDCLLHPRYVDELSGEQPVRITETLIPMERFLLNSTDHMNITADVYISPDFERGCVVSLDDEADDADAWSKFDFETEGLNPEAFGSVENMIESLVDSNGVIPQGMTVRRHMKGAILPTRYGDIYSVMDDIWGDLHVWIWRDGVMKSIDHVKLSVDYSNWQDAVEYILAENIADGLDLAAV